MAREPEAYAEIDRLLATCKTLRAEVERLRGERDEWRAKSLNRGLELEAMNQTFIDCCVSEEMCDQLERYEVALNRIACYAEGDVVTGSFDEPGSARIARAALEEK